MAESYETYLKSRAKKIKAGTLDPGATYLKVGDKEMVTAVKKKKKKFQEYARDWESPPKKLDDSPTTDDLSGGKDGVIKSAGKVQSGIGEKRKQTTKIRRTREPRTGFLSTRNAAKRRKKLLLEI